MLALVNQKILSPFALQPREDIPIVNLWVPSGWDVVARRHATFTRTKPNVGIKGTVRGFGATVGVGTTDSWNTGETQNTDGPISHVILFRSISAGGSSIGRIFQKGTTGTSGSDVLQWSASTLQYRRYNSAATSLCNSVVATSSPTDGLWHGLAFSQSGAVEQAISYLDGVQLTVSSGGLPGGGATNSDPLWIGNRQADSARGFDGEIALVARIFGMLSPGQLRDFSLNPMLMFAPMVCPIWSIGAAGAPTHTTTGVLTGPGAVVAGTAAHQHVATGALTGQAATVAGTSVHTPLGHATTGALTGQGTVVAGTAAHQHSTTGVLTGQGATVAGTVTHFVLHTTTGALTGQAATVAGTAAHAGVVSHDATGTITGPGAVVTGTAVHLSLHATNGIVVGPGAIVSGSAAHTVTASHTTTGVLTGQGALVTGTSLHNAVHTTTGILNGAGAIIVGASFLGLPLVPWAPQVYLRTGVNYPSEIAVIGKL